MDWTYDLATNALTPASGDLIEMKWRAREPQRIQFHRSGTAELLPTGAAIRLYLIAAGTILAAATSWTAPGSADGYYTAELVLHTDELTSAFEDEDTKSLPASIELHWYRTGESASPSISDSTTLSAQLRRPLVTPESDTPIVLDGAEEWLTARAVRFDEAQTLSASEKVQALENIGITGIKAASILRGCLSITGEDDTEYHIPLNEGIPPAL